MNLFGISRQFDLYHLIKFLSKYRNTNMLPQYNDWPEVISLGPDIWNHLLTIRKYTNEENRERSLTLFWADGDIVTPAYTRGQESRVVTQHTAKLEYVPTHKQDYYRKLVTVDGKIMKDYTIHKNKIPKEPQVIQLFNIHTHPKRQNEKGEYFFNLFSAQDITSLANSNDLISGLMIDKLWLVCKTNESKLAAEIIEDLSGIASNFTLNEMSRVAKLKILSKESGFVFYHAKAKGRLVKI